MIGEKAANHGLMPGHVLEDRSELMGRRVCGQCGCMVWEEEWCPFEGGFFPTGAGTGMVSVLHKTSWANPFGSAVKPVPFLIDSGILVTV